MERNKSQTLVRCECQNDCHFGDGSHPHPYMAEVTELVSVRTPIATVQVCQACADTCMKIYVERIDQGHGD